MTPSRVAARHDRRGARGAVGLVGGAVVILALTGAPVRGGAAVAPREHSVQAFMTLYGWVDNSPPGRAIAHPCLHELAGGKGTYANPVTFATDVHELGWCQRIYVPYMQRYFIHEDECAECDHDWVALHRHRFDMWAGGDARSRHNPERAALLACESALTRGSSTTDPQNPTIIVNPPRNLPVATTPIFTPPRRCWKPSP